MVYREWIVIINGTVSPETFHVLQSKNHPSPKCMACWLHSNFFRGFPCTYTGCMIQVGFFLSQSTSLVSFRRHCCDFVPSKLMKSLLKVSSMKNQRRSQDSADSAVEYVTYGAISYNNNKERTLKTPRVFLMIPEYRKLRRHPFGRIVILTWTRWLEFKWDSIMFQTTTNSLSTTNLIWSLTDVELSCAKSPSIVKESLSVLIGKSRT